MRRSFAGLGAYGFLVGCTTNGTTTASPGATPATFATELAGQQTQLAPLPTAVVVLSDTDLNRNRAFCEAFLRLPTVAAAEAASPIAQNIIHTRWPLQVETIGPAQARDCGFLVGAYDYARVRALTISLRRDGNPGLPTGSGPFLVMLMPDASGLRSIGLDGSGYAPQDFPAFIASWNKAVNTVQIQLTQKPPPGIVQSTFGLLVAIMRGVAGVTAGVITGVIQAL